MQTRSHEDPNDVELRKDLTAASTSGVLRLKEWGFGPTVTNAVGKYLKETTSLRKIRLDTCLFSSDGASMLAELPDTNATFKIFKLVNLRSIPLNLFGRILELAVKCPKLHTFTLKKYTKELRHILVTPTLFNIARKSTLTKLCIEGCPDLNRVFPGLAEVLSHSKSIAFVNFSGASLADVFAEHANLFLFKPSLVKLNLSYTDIGDSGLALIAHAVATNPSLTKIDITGNSFSSEGLAVFWDVMDTNTSLHTLKIDLGRTDVSAFKRLHAILSTNATLLSLTCGVRGPYGLGKKAEVTNLCGFLVSALFFNTTLLKFRTSHQEWNTQIRTLTKLLLTNQTLRKLSIKIYDTLYDDRSVLINASSLNGSVLVIPYHYESKWVIKAVESRNKLLQRRKNITFTKLLLEKPSSQSIKRHQK